MNEEFENVVDVETEEAKKSDDCFELASVIAFGLTVAVSYAFGKRAGARHGGGKPIMISEQTQYSETTGKVVSRTIHNILDEGIVKKMMK